MKRYSGRIDPKLTYLLLAIVVITFVVSQILAETSAFFTLAVATALIVGVIAFVNTEVALYILIFSMLLSPEFGERTVRGEGMTLRTDDFLLVIIGFSWLARMALHKELGLFLRTKLNRPIFFYLAVCILSTSIGVLAGDVKVKPGFFFILKYFEYYIVYFMIINHVNRSSQIKGLIVALLLTCLVVNIVGLVQIPTGQRVTAVFEGEHGEPNTLGGFLVLMLAITLSLGVHIDSVKQKVALWILSGLSFYTLLFTQSRGSYGAFLAMYLSLIFLSKKRVFVVILLIAVVSAPLLLPEIVKKRVASTVTAEQLLAYEKYLKRTGGVAPKKIGGMVLDLSTSERIQSWQDGWKAFVKRPIFGYGVTGWQFIDGQYMRVLVETGILGLFTFYILLVTVFRECWKSYQSVQDKFHKGICMGLIAGAIGMLFHCIAANTFIIVRIMEPFWFLVGIVIMCQVAEAAESSEKEQAPATIA